MLASVKMSKSGRFTKDDELAHMGANLGKLNIFEDPSQYQNADDIISKLEEIE